MKLRDTETKTQRRRQRHTETEKQAKRKKTGKKKKKKQRQKDRERVRHETKINKSANKITPPLTVLFSAVDLDPPDVHMASKGHYPLDAASLCSPGHVLVAKTGLVVSVNH